MRRHNGLRALLPRRTTPRSIGTREPQGHVFVSEDHIGIGIATLAFGQFASVFAPYKPVFPLRHFWLTNAKSFSRQKIGYTSRDARTAIDHGDHDEEGTPPG